VANASYTYSATSIREGQGSTDHPNPGSLMLANYASQTGVSGAAVDHSEDAEHVTDPTNTHSFDG